MTFVLCHAFRTVGFVAAAFVLPSMAQAQFTPDWSNGVVSQLPAPALAVDKDRNSVVAATQGGLPVTVHKFGPTGTLLWQRSLTGAASRAFDVATDGGGNIVLAGAVLDASGMPQGALVSKLDAAGNPLWQDAVTTPQAQVHELALDAGGNVYALVQAATAAGPEAQLLKYGADGARQWVRGFGATAMEGLDSLVLNSAGQPLVTGSNGAGQAIVAAFDAQGNPLALINTGARALSLAAGRSGEVYAVGSGGGTGFQVIKYGAAFNELWRTSVATGAALRTVVDPNGDLVMTGAFDLAGGGFGAAVITYNWRTIKLSAAGAVLWSADHGVNSPFMGTPGALGLQPDGSVVVTGRSAEPVPGTTFYRQSMVTLKYSATGVLQGTHFTSTSTGGTDLEVAGDGGVHVMGGSDLVNGTPAPLLHFAAPVLPPATPSALRVTAPVWERSSAIATVTVSSAAGVTVGLNSSNTKAALVPSTLVVPAGATSASFPITTLEVRRDTVVTIRARANGTTVHTTITVLNRR